MLGITVAVLADAASVGLLATSGWFIAACAIAGATVGSLFSYVAPSGAVRAFAVARIATDYVQRVLLHRAALDGRRRVRGEYFAAAAAAPPGTGSDVVVGERLDRAMVDADTVAMRPIRVLAPACSYLVLFVVGVIVTAQTGTVAAVVLAALGVGAPAAALLVHAAAPGRRAVRAADRRRALLRADLVTAIGAWPEMRSLGSGARLRAALLAETARGAAADARMRRRDARLDAVVGVFAAVAVAAVAGAAGGPGATAEGVVLVVLLATGIVAHAASVPGIVRAAVAARAARSRLRFSGAAEGGPAAGPSAGIDASFADGRLRLAHYEVPESVHAPAHSVQADLAVGDALVVTGASGAGKTTLLEALAVTIGEDPARRVLWIPVDDYLFTGTIGDNLRLADPELDDARITAGLRDLDLVGLSAETAVGVGGRELSGGELTRMRVLRGVLSRPEVLLVDEPTVGLDADAATRTLAFLREGMRHGVLVLATHSPAGLPRSYDDATLLSVDGMSSRVPS